MGPAQDEQPEAVARVETATENRALYSHLFQNGRPEMQAPSGCSRRAWMQWSNHAWDQVTWPSAEGMLSGGGQRGKTHGLVRRGWMLCMK